MTPDQPDSANPYSPPRTNAEELSQRSVEGAFNGRLFSPMQIGVATVFGSILGGSLLLQANYRAMGETRAAVGVITTGLLATIGLYVVASNLPGGTWTLVINLAAIVTFCAVANGLHGDLYSEHVVATGLRGSSWWVLGAILLSFGARVGGRIAIKVVLPALAR